MTRFDFSHDARNIEKRKKYAIAYNLRFSILAAGTHTLVPLILGT